MFYTHSQGYSIFINKKPLRRIFKRYRHDNNRNGDVYRRHNGFSEDRQTTSLDVGTDPRHSRNNNTDPSSSIHIPRNITSVNKFVNRCYMCSP